MPDHDGPVDASFRQAIALERTSRAVLCLGIEKTAVLDGPCGTQGPSPLTFQEVVSGVVAKPAERHTALDRLGLRRAQRIDPAPPSPS